MGRGGRQGGQQGSQPWRSGDNGYRIWPGAYSPSQQAAWDKKPWRGDNPKAGAAFPSYASVSLPADRGAAPRDPATRAEDRMARSSTTPAIQTALNHTRKAEGKVVRLKNALEDSGLLWKEYEAQMKEAFRRERARFAKDRERLEREIQDAEEAQEAARQGLRDAFYGAQRGDATGDVPMQEGPDADQVFEEWAHEDEGAANATIRRALAPALATPTRPVAPAPRTPQERGPGISSGAMSMGTPVAVNDPYYTAMSPVMTPAAIQQHLRQFMNGQIPVAPPGLTPVNEAGVPPAFVPNVAPAPAPDGGVPVPSGAPTDEGYGKSPTLQDRVQRRRALEPFGGTAGPPAAAETGQGPRIPTGFRILEDDDELDQVDNADLG